MTKTIQVRFSTVLLALLTCILVVLGWLNFQQRNHFLAPEDGVSWLDSPDGVTAWIVAHDGPADRAGIHQGDRLLNVAGVPVHMAADVTRTIYQAGVWMRITYDLELTREPAFSLTASIHRAHTEGARRLFENQISSG